MMQYVIGVDAGATKTAAAVFSAQDGSPLFTTTVGPGNFSEAPDAAARELLRAVDACRKAVPDGVCVFAAVGAAGMRASGLAESTARLLESRCGCPAQVMDDGLMALHAGLRDRDGVLVIAGTGSVAYARRGDRCASSGGWGMTLDDRGSGTDIALEACRRMTERWDRGLPLTELDGQVLKQLNCETVWQLPAALRGLTKGEIAALAPLVMKAARRGDAGAEEDLRGAGIRLARMAAAAGSRLGLQEPLTVLSGSVLKNCVPVREAFCTAWAAMYPGASFTRNDGPVERGAFWLWHQRREQQ